MSKFLADVVYVIIMFVVVEIIFKIAKAMWRAMRIGWKNGRAAKAAA